MSTRWVPFQQWFNYVVDQLQCSFLFLLSGQSMNGHEILNTTIFTTQTLPCAVFYNQDRTENERRHAWIFFRWWTPWWTRTNCATTLHHRDETFYRTRFGQRQRIGPQRFSIFSQTIIIRKLKLSEWNIYLKEERKNSRKPKSICNTSNNYWKP